MALPTAGYLSVLLLLLIGFSPTFASNGILTCKAARIAGKTSDLSVEKYNNINPTIIINTKEKTLTFVYSEHDQQWKTVFNILQEDKEFILALEAFHADEVRIIHFNKIDNSFSSIFAGSTGNTLEFGRCWGN